MDKGRMEAFSDGVIAILITIMVLELRAPEGSGLSALTPLGQVFLTYVLSFVILGIYWNNHHHLLQAARAVSGGVLWANLHLLFWLSLFPFGAAWMGGTNFARLPTAAYGVILLAAAIAYYLLQKAIIAVDGPHSALSAALGRDLKGKISPVLYAIAIPGAFVNRWIAVALYVAVAVLWFVPDRRLETRARRG
ncbi:MAG TPA: TMEM175 family protein [Acidimicrobiia bacterium]|nr:TMEM175 family protein [Acidimicrobiia bacterium]